MANLPSFWREKGYDLRSVDNLIISSNVNTMYESVGL